MTSTNPQEGGKGWALNLPNASSATIGRGVVQVRDHAGVLVIYRPRALDAVFIGPLTVKGRRLELRA